MNKPVQEPSATPDIDQTVPGVVLAGRKAEWKGLSEKDATEFAEAWLQLLMAANPEVSAARLLLRRPRIGLGLAGEITNGAGSGELLATAADAAAAQRAGVARIQAETVIAAYPVILDNRVEAVVAALATSALKNDELLARLRWASGWLRSGALERLRNDDQPSVERARSAIELLGGALEEDSFDSAARRAVTELSRIGLCDRVAVGFRKRGRARVISISHTAQYGDRMDMVRQVAAAMDEALEQQATLLWPVPPGAAPQITRAHETLSRTLDNAQLLTIPILSRGKFTGAFTFERNGGAPFDQNTIDLLDAASGLTGPVLEERRRNDRWLIAKVGESIWRLVTSLLGRGHLKVKLIGILCIAAIAYFSQARTTYFIGTEAILEGKIQRSLVAPFDGFVTEALVRAGDRVVEGDVMARLDDRDLALERLNLWAAKRRAELEYETAVGERDRAKLNLLRARLEQADAQLALVDGQIARAAIRAPFDGLVVSGDLSQAIGASVARGEALFQIAPLQSYRVSAWVDEAQVDDIHEGDAGAVVLSALPTESFPVEIRRITPVAEIRDGRNMFRIEADIGGPTDRLRPGMAGVAKIDGGDRLLIWTWTRGLIDWAQLTYWKIVG